MKTKLKNLSLTAVISVLLISLTSCNQNTDNKDTNESLLLGSLLINSENRTQSQTFALSGTWNDNWSTEHQFTENSWKQTSSYGTIDKTIPYYSNSDKIFVYQEPATDAYNPSKYGRVVWADISDIKIAYCMDIYGKDTYDEVRNSTQLKPVFNSESDTTCGGFTWTIATKVN